MRRALITLVACGRVDFTPLVDAQPPLMLCLQPVRVSASGGLSLHPGLALLGSERAVAWQDDPSDGNAPLFFATVAENGAVARRSLAMPPYPSGLLTVTTAIAASDTGYAIVWAQGPGSQLYFATLDASGAVTSSTMVEPGAVAAMPSLVWTGTEFAVVFTLCDAGCVNRQVALARFSESGTQIGSTSLLSSNPASTTMPSLVWTGGGFLAAWSDYSTGPMIVHVGAADATGTTTRPEQVLGPTRSRIGIAWNGLRALVATNETALTLTTFDAAGNRDATATFPDPTLLGGTAVTWSGDWDVFVLSTSFELRRFDASLALLDTTPIWAAAATAFAMAGGNRVSVAFVDEVDYPKEVYLADLCR